MKKSDCVYVYDGSFDGLMSCVFEAYEKKEEPVDISVDSNTLLPVSYIETNDEHAARVSAGLLKSLGPEFAYTVKTAYLSREEGAEINILRLIRLGYSKGPGVLKNLNDPLVAKMYFLSKSVSRERHRIIEFLRFTDYKGNLISTINPKHFVLPLIAGHFEQRFPNENFFIYDEVHSAALAHIEGKSAVLPVEEFVMPPVTEDEEKFRSLWKLFYDTIEIKQRRNYKLRMQHLPKRFWKNITELCGELSAAGKELL